MAAEHAQKQAEQLLSEAETAARQLERDDNSVQRRLADQAGTIMGLQHSLQNAQADLHKFHSAHARYCTVTCFSWDSQDGCSCMLFMSTHVLYFIITCQVLKLPSACKQISLPELELQEAQAWIVELQEHTFACLFGWSLACMLGATALPETQHRQMRTDKRDMAKA